MKKVKIDFNEIKTINKNIKHKISDCINIHPVKSVFIWVQLKPSSGIEKNMAKL